MNDIILPTRAELPAQLSRVSLNRTLVTLLGDWSWILGSIFLATTYPSVLTFIAAQLVIASRQHALFLVMHEGTHYLLCRNKVWNDRISNFLAAWPVGFSTGRYRIRHWTHHRHLNTDMDPDWARKKVDPTWQFPMSHLDCWRTSLAHLFGKGLIEMTYALRGLGLEKRDLPKAIPYFSAIAIAITLTHNWANFALYWVLPYFTVLPFLHRVRNIAEHLGLPKTHYLNGSRNILGSKIEAFFFGPHNANLHLIHHTYSYIPCHRLPEARQWLLRNRSFKELAYENDSYLLPFGHSVYHDLINRGSYNEEATNEQRAA